MWEERDKERIVERVMISYGTQVAVKQIEELRDREERNAKWQDDAQHGDIKSCTGEVPQKEAKILVIAKQAKIARNTAPEPETSPPRPSMCTAPQDAPGHDVVHPDAPKQQRQKVQAPIPIEKKACQHKPEIRKPAIRCATEAEIAKQYDGQVEKNKFIGVEKHRNLLFHP